MIQSIHELEKKFTYRDIENYAMLKHGLERNEYMARNEAKAIAEKRVPRPSEAEIEEISMGLSWMNTTQPTSRS